MVIKMIHRQNTRVRAPGFATHISLFGVLILMLSGCPRFEDTPPSPPRDARDSGAHHPRGEVDASADVSPGLVGDDLGSTSGDLEDMRPGLGADMFEGDAPSTSTVTLWAPFADRAWLVYGSEKVEMSGSDGRWFVDAAIARGDVYSFDLQVGDQTLRRSDPRGFGLEDGGVRNLWYNAKKSPLGVGDVSTLVLYELHAGSFHAPDGVPGSFDDAAQRLEHVRDLGANALALMPVHEFGSTLSWGYNPTELYAVERSYGGPEGFARFVDAAHQRSLAVIVDVVYNHLDASSPLCGWSPSESTCGDYFFVDAPLASTDWGPRPNYDDASVYAWVREHPLVWMDTFGVDGFRFDSTSNIRATDHGRGERIVSGENLLADMTGVIRERGGYTIAEDLRSEPAITSRDGYGFDTQWDAGFEYVVSTELTEALGASGRDVDVFRLAELIEQIAEEPFRRVVYAESHDSTGALNGHRRLIEDLREVAEGEEALAYLHLGTALMLTIPAVPMLLQGQEFAAPGAFHDSEPLDWSDSKNGTFQVTRALVRARRDLDGGTPGLTGAELDVRHVNPGAQVLTFRRSSAPGDADDVMVLFNFSDSTYGEYKLGVPAAGEWVVRVDTSGSHEFGSAFVASAGAYDEYPATLEVALPARSALILSLARE